MSAAYDSVNHAFTPFFQQGIKHVRSCGSSANLSAKILRYVLYMPDVIHESDALLIFSLCLEVGNKMTDITLNCLIVPIGPYIFFALK